MQRIPGLNDKRIVLLVAVVILAVVILYVRPPVSQPLSFHHFADDRRFLGVANALNVVSNLAFCIVGLWGIISLLRERSLVPGRWMYFVLFGGILFTGFGSAWYHLSPDNSTLVFDRLPMVIIFMSFFAIVVSEWIERRAGQLLIVPLVLLGVWSVWWWEYSEQRGEGDLRAYLLVQFLPMILTPLVLLLFKGRAGKGANRPLLYCLGWYVLAKVFEALDSSIYSLSGHLVSGHTIKHLLAAIACLCLVLFCRKRQVRDI